MSTVDMDLFSPAPQDEQHPEFAKAFLGFDPHDVEEFVTQAGERIAVLERQLRDTRAQVEGAHRHAAAAREEAYREVAARMAELLRAADHQVEKLRRETEEACRHQLSEATAEAEHIRRQAETEADGLRAQASDELATARSEARRVIGDLVRHREAVTRELEAMREHMVGLIEGIQAATAVSEPSVVLPEMVGAPAIQETPQTVVAVDDLLDSVEGFDLALPPLEPMEDDGLGEQPQPEG